MIPGLYKLGSLAFDKYFLGTCSVYPSPWAGTEAFNFHSMRLLASGIPGRSNKGPPT